VRFDRPLADPQIGRDVLAGVTRQHEIENLCLSSGERGECRYRTPYTRTGRRRAAARALPDDHEHLKEKSLFLEVESAGGPSVRPKGTHVETVMQQKLGQYPGDVIGLG
jgi:hypothetical protein